MPALSREIIVDIWLREMKSTRTASDPDVTNAKNIHRPLGATGILVPPIAFRAAVLADSRRVLPEQTKRLICGEWFRHVRPPVFIDVVFDESRTTPLKTLGRLLSHFDVAPEEVVINLELDGLGNLRNPSEPHRLRKQFRTACELLGKLYGPRVVTLRLAMDHDESTATTFDTNWATALVSVRELELLKTESLVAAVGIAPRDWRLGKRLLDDVAEFEFVKLLRGPTVLRHPPEMLAWLGDLAARTIPVVTAGVFHGGFLAGGSTFDGRMVDPEARADQSLAVWRKAFTALCHGHGTQPARACVQFVLSVPGVVAVSLTTSHPDRVAENVAHAVTKAPESFWWSLKEEPLFSADYRHTS
jgi:D-threo-aldose 1-dehydrogenase